MIINIEVKNRVATYRSYGTDPVCGCNTDEIQFHFDEEWQDVGVKTARFVWGEQYFNQEFTGDRCPVPMFWNVTRVLVGVYAGEPAANESGLATTRAEIPYGLSIRCGYYSPRAESGNGYTNEAKGYAAQAQAAARMTEGLAQQAAQSAAEAAACVEEAYGLHKVGELTLPCRCEYKYVYDEMGMTDEKLMLVVDGQYVSYRDGSLLIRGDGDVPLEEIPEEHRKRLALENLMNSRLVELSITHSDSYEVLYYKTVYKGMLGSTVWCPLSMRAYDETYGAPFWDTGAEEWPAGVPHFAVTDEPRAPGYFYGPFAIFLQFTEDFRKVLSHALLLDEMSEFEIKLTAYN